MLQVEAGKSKADYKKVKIKEKTVKKEFDTRTKTTPKIMKRILVEEGEKRGQEKIRRKIERKTIRKMTESSGEG